MFHLLALNKNSIIATYTLLPFIRQPLKYRDNMKLYRKGQAEISQLVFRRTYQA